MDVWKFAGLMLRILDVSLFGCSGVWLSGVCLFESGCLGGFCFDVRCLVVWMFGWFRVSCLMLGCLVFGCMFLWRFALWVV